MSDITEDVWVNKRLPECKGLRGKHQRTLMNECGRRILSFLFAVNEMPIALFLTAQWFLSGGTGGGFENQFALFIQLKAPSSQERMAHELTAFPDALYRYDPKLSDEHKNPFQLDPHGPKIPEDYIYTEGLPGCCRSDPEVAKFLLGQAQKSVHRRWEQYKQLAQMTWHIFFARFHETAKLREGIRCHHKAEGLFAEPRA